MDDENKRRGNDWEPFDIVEVMIVVAIIGLVVAIILQKR